MAVIRTSTGTVQEVATENGPMTTAAGSRQMGVVDDPVVGATQIPGADTYFYLDGSGMQEVTPAAGGGARNVFDETPTPYAVFALQRVRSDYTGPIVTLRRTSDNAEQAFWAGSNGYLSRSAVITWAGAVETRVKTWHDQMGAHDATQTTAGNQPIFDWSGVEPMIYNLTVPTSLRLSNALGFARNKSGVTIAALADATIPSTAIVSSFRSGTGNAQGDLRIQGGKLAGFYRRTNADAATPVPTSAIDADNTGWHSIIGEALYAGNTAAITVEGVRSQSGNFGGAANSPDEDATESPVIGGAPNAASPWFGFYRAVAFFAQTVDAAQRTAITDALNYLKPASSNRYIAAWGDSLTAGGYPVYLRGLFDSYRYVHDGGVGGESIASIRARMVADNFYDARINLLEGGRNGFKTVPAADIKADMDLMIAKVKGDRWLVGSVTPFANDPNTGTGADTSGDLANLNALNALYASSYGDRFLDMLPILQAANDGSANDLADVAAGWIPRSLRTDGGHLNATGQLVKATAYRNKMLAMGWYWA